MGTPLVVNGVTYNYPNPNDTGWGYDATGWAVAVTAGLVPKNGGAFTLTGNVNFGNVGKLLGIFSSPNSNPATTGILNLAYGDSIAFRNGANTSDLLLTVNGSNQLVFNGSVLSGGVSSIAATGSLGLTVGGSPITTSGTLTFTLGTELQGLSQLSANGFVARTGSGTYSSGSVAVSSANTAISISGSPLSAPGTITVTSNQFTSTTPGHAPASGGGTTDYLRADGTWAVPSGSGSVTSVAVSGGTTGLTTSGGPITTAGTITIAGTLTIANGGTGQTSQTTAFDALSPLTTQGDILYYNGTHNVRLAAGSIGQILTTNGGGANPSWTNAGSGSVTSVAAQDGSTTPIYGVFGSPITSNGTLNFVLVTQAANKVFAGPSSGSAAQPTFRSLVTADLSGVTLAIANGGTGQTTQTAAFDALSPLTTTGDLIYYNGTHNVRLGVGTTGQILSVSGGIPSWSSAVGSGTVTSVGITPGTGLTSTGGPITTSGNITVGLLYPTTQITASTGNINTVETYIPTAMSIPANTLVVGQAFRIKALAASSSSNNGDVSTFTLRIGSAGTTADTSFGTFTLGSVSGNNGEYYIVYDIVVRTIGSSGTCYAVLSVTNPSSIPAGISAGNTYCTVVQTGSTTLNTTGNLFLGFSYKTNAATTSSNFGIASIEAIR